MSDENKIVSIRPSIDPEAKPFFEQSNDYGKCRHETSTFQVDTSRHTVTCSVCKELVEAIVVVEMLLNRENRTARNNNAQAWHRFYAEELAEKQANKTRKAAYATLLRFGVTPEMYAEEHRRAALLADLEAKQDYSQTVMFKKS